MAVLDPGAVRNGLRHDGDGLTDNAIRYIQGKRDAADVPIADKPGILALGYNGGGDTPVETDKYALVWAAILGGTRHIRLVGTNQDPDASFNEDGTGDAVLMSGNGTTLVQIKHVPAVTKFGAGLSIAHGLTTALAVFTQIETDGAAPAATDTCAVFTTINGANIDYDCYEEDFITASASAMGGIDFLVIGI